MCSVSEQVTELVRPLLPSSSSLPLQDSQSESADGEPCTGWTSSETPSLARTSSMDNPTRSTAKHHWNQIRGELSAKSDGLCPYPSRRFGSHPACSKMHSRVSNESPSSWPCTDSGPEKAMARCSAPSPRWDVAWGFAPHWRSSRSTTTPCNRGMQALYKSGVRPSAFSCSMSQPLPTSRLIKATISSSLMSSEPGRV